MKPSPSRSDIGAKFIPDMKRIITLIISQEISFFEKLRKASVRNIATYTTV